MDIQTGTFLGLPESHTGFNDLNQLRQFCNSIFLKNIIQKKNSPDFLNSEKLKELWQEVPSCFSNHKIQKTISSF